MRSGISCVSGGKRYFFPCEEGQTSIALGQIAHFGLDAARDYRWQFVKSAGENE
jgi:hypothetical protein